MSIFTVIRVACFIGLWSVCTVLCHFSVDTIGGKHYFWWLLYFKYNDLASITRIEIRVQNTFASCFRIVPLSVSYKCWSKTKLGCGIRRIVGILCGDKAGQHWFVQQRQMTIVTSLTVHLSVQSGVIILWRRISFWSFIQSDDREKVLLLLAIISE